MNSALPIAIAILAVAFIVAAIEIVTVVRSTRRRYGFPVSRRRRGRNNTTTRGQE